MAWKLEVYRVISHVVPSTLQETPLHGASSSGRVKVVNYLLEKQAEVNAANKNKVNCWQKIAQCFLPFSTALLAKLFLA